MAEAGPKIIGNFRRKRERPSPPLSHRFCLRRFLRARRFSAGAGLCPFSAAFRMQGTGKPAERRSRDTDLFLFLDGFPWPGVTTPFAFGRHPFFPAGFGLSKTFFFFTRKILCFESTVVLSNPCPRPVHGHAQEEETALLQAANPRARVRIRPEQVHLQAKTRANLPKPVPDRPPSQNLVPKPPRQGEKGP